MAIGQRYLDAMIDREVSSIGNPLDSAHLAVVMINLEDFLGYPYMATNFLEDFVVVDGQIKYT